MIAEMVLATLLLGPLPSQTLYIKFAGEYAQPTRTMPADDCFQAAADLTRHAWLVYGPYQHFQLEFAFCMDASER